MSKLAARYGRWPVALTLVALAACSDEPAAPHLSAPTRPNAAAGDVYTVTNTNDSGLGSLRWALKFSTGGEIIRFDPSLAGKIIGLDSSIYINRSVTIEGPAGAGITIDGKGTPRMFWARFTGSVTFRNLSLTGANTSAGVGSVIYADANLTFENALVHDNIADAGVAVVGGNVTLINSTVTRTVNANGQTYDYPAVMGDTVTLINSTVSHNGWGGVGAFSGLVTLRNSIVSNNVGKNCVRLATGTVTREGANISDDDTCGGPGEIMITDPLLGPLADNGGPTKTYALLAGSPAINTGVGCSVQVDQRYAPRDAQCDLGAFEFVDFTKVTVTIDGSAGINQNNRWATVTGTVTCTRTETFDLAVEIRQTQKVGKETLEVDAAATIPVYCTTGVRPRSASMYLTNGEFQIGTAQASAFTLNTAKWVTPSSATKAVKLFNTRK